MNKELMFLELKVGAMPKNTEPRELARDLAKEQRAGGAGRF